MKKMITSAVLAFAVLAACNTNPATNPTTNLETIKQPSNAQAKVLGVLEVELSSEQGSVSSAKFIETGSTGLSAKGVAVPITASNWVFTPGATTYMTDANFKYLQNTITLENKTGTSFSNLAMYALNTPANIGGTAFSAVKTLAGVALTGTAASTVARAVMPTHGMTNVTTVDPNKADLMLYTPDEAAAVQAQLIAPNFTLSSPTVLEYGFLARNLAAGARAIGTSAAACPSGPTCNKATITWAFKFPLSLPNSSNLGKFSMRYLVVNEEAVFSATKVFVSDGSHDCALTNTGGIKCWGYNGFGQLGNGETQPYRNPVSVEPLSYLTSGIKSMALGGATTCILTNLSGVKCWGSSEYGQIGDGVELSSNIIPQNVFGLTSGVKAITAGTSHACALLNTGNVKCWGRSGAGQLGNPSSIIDPTNSNTYLNKSLVPLDVVNLSDVKIITSGTYHVCALTLSGNVKCWGANYGGQLGNGSDDATASSPVDAVGLSEDIVVDIAAGGSNTCILNSLGGVKCWGDNTYGQLGINSYIYNSHVPVSVIGLESGVKSISLGDTHMCALTILSTVKCWGSNYSGELGDDTFIAKRIPVNVEKLNVEIASLSSGASSTCGTTKIGGIKCWGNNYQGRLGTNGPNDITGNSAVPLDVIGFSGH
jgi:alpha-tubulin suppressor-like RCC1 family protein